MAVTDRGQIVGSSTTASGDAHAFLWQQGRMTDLGTLGGNMSIAYAVNNRGQVAGKSVTASGLRRAFLWEEGQMRDLGVLGPSASSIIEAFGVNEQGQIVGVSWQGSPGITKWNGFIWQRGGMSALPPESLCSGARAINNAGHVAGHAGICLGESVAAMWDRGEAVYLGTLAPAGGGNAQAINGRGQIAGGTWAGLIKGYRAFLWTPR